MNKNISVWQLIGFIFTVGGGVLLHFLYEWSNEARWAAPFSSVNESTWEHMKLLFIPALIFAFVQSLIFRDRKDFWNIKLKGILLGLILIPTLFYLYNGVIGESNDIVNIAIFVISVFVMFIYENKLFKTEKKDIKTSKYSLPVLLAIAILFVVFTFKTPKIKIFEDPTTYTYGIK